MKDPDDLTSEEIEELAFKIRKDFSPDGDAVTVTEDAPPRKLQGRSVEEFLKRADIDSILDSDNLDEKVAASQCEYGNRAVDELLKTASAGDVSKLCNELTNRVDDFEAERAKQLGLSPREYRETIARVVKEASKKKVVLGSEREDGVDAIDYRKNFHIQRLKALVSMHTGIPEDQLSDYDIEKIHSQLTPAPKHVPLIPNNGVSELELGFQYLIEKMDQQIEEDLKPEPTVVTQVVETAFEVKTEVGSVLDALQDKAKSALEELALNSKRNLGKLLRRSAEYAVQRIEHKERHLSEKELNTLKSLVDDAQGDLISTANVSKLAEGIEELEPVVKSLGDAEARLEKILRATGSKQTVAEVKAEAEAASTDKVVTDTIDVLTTAFDKYREDE